MRIIFGLLAILLLLLSLYLGFQGWAERFNAYIELVENTASEKRAAVSKAYRESWGLDKWSIGAVICLGGSRASGVAAFRLSKNKSSQTT